MQFDDYHRTVIGYHGARLSVAQKIINRTESFKFSENDDDWLGHGIYFWEYAPQQALWWAEERRRKQNWNEPIAILASMIRLGFCFDLLDPYNIKYLRQMHDDYQAEALQIGIPTPQNRDAAKRLDCAVFNYVYLDHDSKTSTIDTSRAVYVPTGKDRRIWKRSWISQNAHIQLCVRNRKCILGTWLHWNEEKHDDDG